MNHTSKLIQVIKLYIVNCSKSEGTLKYIPKCLVSIIFNYRFYQHFEYFLLKYKQLMKDFEAISQN